MSEEHSVPSGDAVVAALSAEARDRFPCIVALDDVGSTNDVAFDMTRMELPDGTVVLARSQTRGRGRLDRTWSSPPGNLYLSLVRRMPEGEENAGAMALLAGLALANAVERVHAPASPAETSEHDKRGGRPRGLRRIELKWPNDLLVEGRKLAGILVEARSPWQVIGVGLNVNCRVQELPPDLRLTAATMLDLTGRTWPIEALAVEFLSGFAVLESRFIAQKSIPVDAYMDRMWGIGRAVAVHGAGRQISGTIAAVAGDGALLLDCRGVRTRVLSGEVVHVR